MSNLNNVQDKPSFTTLLSPQPVPSASIGFPSSERAEGERSSLCESISALTESINISNPSIDALGWSLAGEGVARADCGNFGYRGCLKVMQHPEGKKFVKRFKISCDRRECPICVKKWAMREAHGAVHRLLSFKHDGYRKIIHVILSPPQNPAQQDVRKLRKDANRITKRLGIYGGLLVFHPARRSTRGREWSPHFHSLCYGWVSNVGAVYRSEGWVTKNLGLRKSVIGTISYLLSHAGVKKTYQAVSWFGALSYNKFHCEKEPDEDNLCPYCFSVLRKLLWEGGQDRPPPLPEDFEGLTDLEGFEISESYGWKKQIGRDWPVVKRLSYLDYLRERGIPARDLEAEDRFYEQLGWNARELM